MVKHRTVSQCISSDYCKGWNDCVEQFEKHINDKTILSLRAVLYGCQTNKKLVCGHFACNIESPEKMQMIPFDEAVENVAEFVVKLMERGIK